MADDGAAVAAEQAPSLNDNELRLLRATLVGDMATTRRLVQGGGVNVNCIHPTSKMTPLCFATHGNHLEIARFLMDASCDLNKPCSLGSPVLLGAVVGSTAIVRLLAQRGADLWGAGKNGITPITAACNRGHLDIVQLLVEYAGRRILQPAEGSEALSAFTCAFMADQFDVLRWLVQAQGISINARMKQCRHATPLYFAATQRNLAMCRFLVEEMDAEVDLKTLDGETALFTASRGGGGPIVSYLIERGADANARNKDGTTPLLAAIHSLDDSTVEKLVQGGADPNATAPGGISGLHMAASKGLLTIMTTLVNHGATISHKSSAILLHLACRSGHAGIVEYLLTKRPLLRRVCDHDKWKTPLLTAREHNHINLVRYLVEQMASGCSEQMNRLVPGVTSTTTLLPSRRPTGPEKRKLEDAAAQENKISDEKEAEDCPKGCQKKKRFKAVTGL